MATKTPSFHIHDQDNRKPIVQGSTPDQPLTGPDDSNSSDTDQYTRFSSRHKAGITAVLSLCALLSPLSSTMILAAIPEVAATFNRPSSLISLSNAIYLLAMGFSACLWGSMSSIFGRRCVCIICAAQFLAFSVGTALSPNIAAFFVFRLLTAFPGTSLLIVANACVGDIYEPVRRATALGWFSAGTIVAPAAGPFIGGIIVTLSTWRTIFWFQSALSGIAAISLVVFVPETIPRRDMDSFHGLPRAKRIRTALASMSPLRVMTLLFLYPNLLLTAIASSALIWNMYSLLTPIRHVLNDRFNLVSPLQSGLFYLAPGCGYAVGTMFGGRWADHVVKLWMTKRGHRIPEDRLRSSLLSLGVVVPASMLVYGWCLEKQRGGIAVPVVAMFVQGVAQWFAFPCLNTYCLDVMQSYNLSAEVVAGNYLLRYSFAALGSAVCIPGIERLGIGIFSTISCGFLVVGTIGVCLTIREGSKRRDARGNKLQNLAS